MKQFITNLKTQVKDKTLLSFLLFATIIFIFHFWQYVETDKCIYSLMRIILFGSFPIFWLFSYNGILVWSSIFAFTLVNHSSYDSYSAFFILVLVAVFLHKNMKMVMFITYIINVIFRFNFLYHDTHHLAIHLLNCAWIFCAIKYILKPTVFKDKLVLLPDEEIILEHLANGMRQNEILEFAPNTVCKKLKEAKIRNNFKHTEDLILSYMNSTNHENRMKLNEMKNKK